MRPDYPRYATTTKVDVWGRVMDIIKHVRFDFNRFRVSTPRWSKFAFTLCIQRLCISGLYGAI